MKYYIIVLVFLFTSCGQGIKQERKHINSDKEREVKTFPKEEEYFTGVYEYVYPDNGSLTENHYIRIKKTDNKYVGFYYGTSDEFDDSREGYYPGYFVATMENLTIDSDFIKFNLSVSNEKILTKTVDLKIESYEKAIQLGYENWPHKMTFEPKNYIGEFLDTNTIFFKGEMDFLDKKFYKINP